ncbi:MAG: ribosome biogenesis protein [Candidatus Lokiarchaeota archaeon]|nr:ribosome biogenesis protein [Candidatus Lokiarchaeota archaeon]
MPKTLSKCLACKAYTMKDGVCPSCGGSETRSVYPPKFSIDDKYGKYRREMKRQLQQRKPEQ